MLLKCCVWLAAVVVVVGVSQVPASAATGHDMIATGNTCHVTTDHHVTSDGTGGKQRAVFHTVFVKCVKPLNAAEVDSKVKGVFGAVFSHDYNECSWGLNPGCGMNTLTAAADAEFMSPGAYLHESYVRLTLLDDGGTGTPTGVDPWLVWPPQCRPNANDTTLFCTFEDPVNAR
jgi:hypothetical protein